MMDSFRGQANFFNTFCFLARTKLSKNSNVAGKRPTATKDRSGLCEVQLRCCDQTVWIEHELLRRSFVEVLVTLNRPFQLDDGHVDRLSDLDFVVQDSHHQLPVVLQHRTLARGENVRFRPSQADADTEISMLGSLVQSSRIVRYIEPGDAERTARSANGHQRIQYGSGSFLSCVLAVPASFETNAIHRTIHLRDLEDLGNLVADRGLLGDVHGFAAKAAGLLQALGDQVADNDDGGPQQLAGGRAGESDRPSPGNIHRSSRTDTRTDRAVIARRQNVGKAGQVSNL